MNNTIKKRIAFFGTPDFTTDFLDTLSAHGYVHDYEIALIVTNPDRPAGRGMTLMSPAPKIWGIEHGVPVVQPEYIDEVFLGNITETAWDLFVVVAYGKILPEQLLAIPSYGIINVHYSLLPEYRGATPVESALHNGDTATGVTIQSMRFKLDSGPVLAKACVAIEPTDTTLTLRARLNKEALTLLPLTIDALFAGTATALEQDESRTSYCGKIQKADGEISLDDDPILNDRKFRAHVGNVGTYFYTEKNTGRMRVKITKAHLENDVFVIDEVIPENGKRMPGGAYMLRSSSTERKQ